MKIFTRILLIIIAVFLLWPYLNFYRLNNAVSTNNIRIFEQLVDIDSIRKVRKENIEWKIQKLQGKKGSFLPDIIANAAIDRMITYHNLLASLRQINGSLSQHTSFIFFESPTRFMVRLGQLGHNPLYIEMTLQTWFWRVTAIYE
jgi:hypothetical protein